MIPALVGRKIGMTQVITDRGVTEPATVVQAGPCVVMCVRTRKSDGYDAVQLGFGDVKPHRSTKALIGHAAKAGTGPKRFCREVRLAEATEVECGAVLTVELFREGVEYVDVSGITKGKGFQGVMKRYGFGGQPASHGTERKHRSAGGIGGMSTRGTGRAIKKGKRMSGHMGDVRTTMTNLRLLSVDPENDLLVIRGSVPGANGSFIMIRKAKKSKSA
jgi:large subunit ribosomal protein L3